MKFLLLTCMVLSTQAFAFSGHVKLSPEEAKNVSRALSENMSTSNLKCELEARDTGKKDVISTGRMSGILGEGRIEVYIDESSAQPVILLTRDMTAHMPGMVEEFLITTTPDLKSILEIEGRVVIVTKKEVNVGTLVKPKYEIQELEEVTHLVNCK